MTIEWFVRLSSGKESGPFSESQIKGGLDKGKIPRGSKIRQGNSPWFEAALVHAKLRQLERDGWYVLEEREGSPRGPFTRVRLSELVNANQIQPRALVRRGTEGQWSPVERSSAAELPADDIATQEEAVGPVGTTAASPAKTATASHLKRLTIFASAALVLGVGMLLLRPKANLPGPPAITGDQTSVPRRYPELSPQEEVEKLLMECGARLEGLESAKGDNRIELLRTCLSLTKSAFICAERHFPDLISSEAHLAARDGFVRTRAVLHKTLSDNRRFADALAMSSEARELVEGLLGGESYHATNIRLDEDAAMKLGRLTEAALARHFDAQGSPLLQGDPMSVLYAGEEGVRELLRLRNVFGETVGDNSGLVADASMRIAWAKQGLGDFSALENLPTIIERVYGRSHQRYAYILSTVGVSVMSRGQHAGDLERGRSMLMDADRICKTIYEEHDPQRYQIQNAIDNLADREQTLAAQRCPNCEGRGRVIDPLGQPGEWERCRRCAGTGKR